MKIIDEKTGSTLNAKIIFSFVCSKNKKKYVIFDFQNNIYEPTSPYVNLNLLEIKKEESNSIYVSEVDDSEWDIVKDSLQNDVLSNIKN